MAREWIGKKPNVSPAVLEAMEQWLEDNQGPPMDAEEAERLGRALGVKIFVKDNG